MTIPQQSLMVHDDGRTKLSPFGSSSEVREFAKRLLPTITVNLKGGDTRYMSGPEAGMMATACIAHGLDPFIGDIYPMEKDGKFSLIPGRGAWVKAANRAMEKQGGGNVWFEERLITDTAERMSLLIDAGAIAYEVKMYDTPTIRAYSEAVAAMSQAGAPWSAIESALGARPCIVALGVYSTTASSTYSDKMWPPHERAKKRGRCACLKVKFNLPFDDYGEGADDLPDDYRSKRESTAIVDEGSQDANQDAERAQRARAKAALYGDDEAVADAGTVQLVMDVPSAPTPTPVAPPVTSAPSKANGNWRNVKVKTAKWKVAQDVIAKALPKYANKDGKANGFHILGALASEGYQEINDANVGELLGVLQARAKADAEQKAEEVTA